jgi:hypothetical protein
VSCAMDGHIKVTFVLVVFVRIVCECDLHTTQHIVVGCCTLAMSKLFRFAQKFVFFSPNNRRSSLATHHTFVSARSR